MTYISCPTQALVLKWLRIVHGIHVTIHVSDRRADKWIYEFYYLRTHHPTKACVNGFSNDSDAFDTHEKAVEEGIQYTLKNLIK